MARVDKEAAVAELTEEFRSSQGAVLTEYRGLTVAQLAELRAKLGDVASYAVVKNTLTKIAARDAGVDAFEELLVGPSAIAFVKGDPVEAARSLRDFARAHPMLVIKGGVLDGAPLAPAELLRLADLESREVLLAKLAGAMKASLSGAAALFQAPLAQAVRAIEALRAKVEEQTGAATADPAAGAGTDDAGAGTDHAGAGTDDAGTGTDDAAAEAGPSSVPTDAVTADEPAGPSPDDAAPAPDQND